MKHPEKWYIPVTKENCDELDRWRQSVATSYRQCPLRPNDSVLLSKHLTDGSCYYSDNVDNFRFVPDYNDYQEITLEQFREIINSKPMKHPEKWYIPVTQENHAELEPWWRKQALKSGWISDPDRRLPDEALVLSQHPTDPSYYWSGDLEYFATLHPSYQKITLEEFRQITNSNQTQTTMTKQIQISRELLNEYYEAATIPQKEYLTEHFKLDGTTTDEAIRGLHELACSAWKPRIKANHPDCFPEDSKYFDFSEFSNRNDNRIVSVDVCESLGLIQGFIRVRYNTHNPETHHRSFYLDSDYNWELVQDGTEDGRPVMVLIPTKKSSK
jgi:hypothetical protein